MHSVDDAVLQVLRDSLSQDPSQETVRRHLAGLLLRSEHPGEALEHARHVLATAPADVEMLRIAAAAAEALGEDATAAGFRTLLEALGQAAEKASGAEAEGVVEKRVAEAKPDPVPQPAAEPAQQPQDEDVDEERPNNLVRLHLVGSDDGDGDGGTDDLDVPQVTLADVAGMHEVKRRIELSFLAPLRNPALRSAYQKSLRGGLLLYGPPGCGKTFIASALAGELQARFLTVDLTDVLDMWLGQSERNLHELFELARRNAPCVLFVDEIDALGRSRSLVRHSAAMAGVVNQFLTEMDGAQKRNEGVYVLAATNQPWDVDPALRRPGRLDRTLLVLPPDREAREQILRSHLDGRPVEPQIDLAAIAKRTEEYSGADLVHLCDVATELALERSAATGVVSSISQGDLKRARKEVRPSIRPWLQSARNYALFANEGGAYDDLAAYLKQRRMG